MSYLKKKPPLPAEEPMPRKLHKEHPKKNNLEELIGLVKEEPAPTKPAWDGSSDELKLIYHIITGTTSHTTKAKMLQKIKEWAEGVD